MPGKIIKPLIILAFLSISVMPVLRGQGGNPYLRPLNCIHLNVLGDACIISLNYDYLYYNVRKFFISGIVGIGYSESMTLPNENTSLLSLPLHVTGNYGEKKHFFEFGFGGNLFFYDFYKYWDYSVYPIVGYRFQPMKKDKVNFRVYASYPLNHPIDLDYYWFFPVGVSMGFCF